MGLLIYKIQIIFDNHIEEQIKNYFLRLLQFSPDLICLIVAIMLFGFEDFATMVE